MACRHADKSSPATPDFLKYSLSGEEGGDFVTAKFEFHSEDDDKALLLRDSARVELDGVMVKADSARFSGAYYEANLPLSGFEGGHTISYTGSDGTKIRDTFLFQPFRLGIEPDSVLHRRALSIPIQGLSTAGDTLLLVMIDTSFRSPDVNEQVIVRNGKIEIPLKYFDRLENGPVVFELHQEKHMPVGGQNGMPGELTIFYALKREFMLTD